jgi:hypothetical protein
VTPTLWNTFPLSDTYLFVRGDYIGADCDNDLMVRIYTCSLEQIPYKCENIRPRHRGNPIT